jgi:Uma2 family endonuclease
MIAVQTPPRTMLEVFRMLPEGTHAELIEDQLFMSPAPTLQHQEILADLFAQIHAAVKSARLGKVYFAPVDVFLNEKNVFQPDLVFVAQKNLGRLAEDGIHGAPDLIVEILSDTTKSLDLSGKKKQYEAAGVEEYWVVDSKTCLCTGFRLTKGKYRQFAKQKGVLASPLLRHTFKLEGRR